MASAEVWEASFGSDRNQSAASLGKILGIYWLKQLKSQGSANNQVLEWSQQVLESRGCPVGDSWVFKKRKGGG